MENYARGRAFRSMRKICFTFVFATHLVIVFGMFLATVANVSDALVGNHLRRQHVAIVKSSADVDRTSVRVATASDRGFWQRLTCSTTYPPVGCNYYELSIMSVTDTLSELYNLSPQRRIDSSLRFSILSRRWIKKFFVISSLAQSLIWRKIHWTYDKRKAIIDVRSH